MSDFITRRQLLKGGSLIAVGMVAPRWLSAVAHAEVMHQAKGGKPSGDTVLVVCQLSGGNDGLNTVVPYANKLYYEYRPTVGLKEADLLKLNEQLGLHPAMGALHGLYKEGKVAIINNVGYPKSNRSHFKSMEIWQSASPDDKLKHGWLGRHFDAQLAGGPLNPIVALGLSTEKPLALTGANASIPCFASLADVQNMIGDSDTERLLRQIQGKEAAAGTSTRLVQQASNTALEAMGILKAQVGKFTPKGAYPNDAFGNGFKQISQLIATCPTTRVVYFSAGGFDTHAQQPQQHERLLRGFSDSVAAFQKEMEALGKADKVIVLAFSEFGRRARENASLGTDHGSAAPMFLIGNRVKGGIHGPLPDLANLDNGDIAFTQDFRGVYATTLDQWLGGDSPVVLGSQFAHVDVLR
ncbi:MAG: DUF1501 domain-containing protein [Fimbriimonadaceae bacterium]|nr:DUF1501 domain-containing protein [Fimbriimonadaceae bacterium]